MGQASGEASARKARWSSSDGGRPVRSSAARRSNVARSASGLGVRPFSAKVAATNPSMALPPAGIAGAVALRGSWKAQWPWYSAPSAIQRRTVSTCADERTLWNSAGGMWSSGSVVSSRFMTELRSGWPGTIAGSPDLPPLRAASSVSRRSLPLFLLSSGPWQAKQVSEKIGRMSRLNWTRSAAVAATVVRAAASRNGRGDGMGYKRMTGLTPRVFLQRLEKEKPLFRGVLVGVWADAYFFSGARVLMDSARKPTASPWPAKPK